MPRQKEVLRPCRFEVAKGKRHCGRDKKHIISPGETCLTFHENMRDKSYCLPCARPMLERARTQLEALLQGF
jgi:hypothetical protein